MCDFCGQNLPDLAELRLRKSIRTGFSAVGGQEVMPSRFTARLEVRWREEGEGNENK